MGVEEDRKKVILSILVRFNRIRYESASRAVCSFFGTAFRFCRRKTIVPGQNCKVRDALCGCLTIKVTTIFRIHLCTRDHTKNRFNTEVTIPVCVNYFLFTNRVTSH